MHFRDSISIQIWIIDLKYSFHWFIIDIFIINNFRERIKDSCDQLRVLLPYIRGRKTDMASILEMCVDYLQIVNTVMPQQLHNQVSTSIRLHTKHRDEQCIWSLIKVNTYHPQNSGYSIIVAPLGKGGAIMDLGCPSFPHSVRHSFISTQFYLFVLKMNKLIEFNQIFVYALILIRSRFELLHIIFHTFVLELLPLIDVRILFKISFLLNILRQNDRISPNFVYVLILTRSREKRGAILDFGCLLFRPS